MRYTFLLLAAFGMMVGGCASMERPGSSEGAASVFQAPTHCPDCGRELVKVGTIHDDPNKPSKNIAVWNRSICGNPFYGSNSVICTNCWLAYSSSLDLWERSSEFPESFRRPLTAAIRDCPLPHAKDTKSLVFYSQEIGITAASESVVFWCVSSGDFIPRLREFAKEHNLSLRIEQEGRIPNQVFVAVETKAAP